MKVILLKDVAGTGRRNDVKDVNPGYAGNFLLPRKLAVVATAEAVKKLELHRSKSDEENKIREELMRKTLDALSGKTVTVKEKANDEGHLFKSVNKKEILAAIKKQLSFDIGEEMIELPKPIKEIGDHELTVSGEGKTVTFKVATEKE